MAMVSASGTFWRPASVTKPDRRLCAENGSASPASRLRLTTMSRTAAAASGSPITPPRRTRRNSGPSLMPAAASQASSAAAAAPTIGLMLSA